MFVYYATLALRSLRRNPILTALMVLCIGLGIGASMTMITVLRVMSGDPLPGRSAELYVPQFDPQPLSHHATRLSEPPADLTWPDAMHLLAAHKADQQAAMAAGMLPVYPTLAIARPFFDTGHYVSAEFFAMFGAPFDAGSGWSAQDDDGRARVVVLSASLAHKLFGTGNPIGQTVRLKNTDFRIVGVLRDWNPQPMFYAPLSAHLFNHPDDFFLPLQTALDLSLNMNGDLSCWGSGDDRLSDHCTWVQFWVRLTSTGKADAYRRFLSDYWHEQKAHGRFPRDQPPQLFGLMDWLGHMHVVPGDLRLQLWLALSFLGACMVNIVALMLAKFMRRSGEVSVRRALGAQRRDVFAQFGIEAATIGLSGGVLGLLLAQLGLWSVRQRPDDYAQLAHMDAPMWLATFAMAIGASVLAGLIPAWRASVLPPALALKIQ